MPGTSPVLSCPEMSAAADPASDGAGPVPRRTATASHSRHVLHALLWSAAAGFLFSMLNVLARKLTIELHPLQAQFLRYAFGAAVLLPWALRRDLATWHTTQPGFFTEVPTQHSIAGGVVICAATVWVARRESHARRAMVQEATP